MYCDYMKQKQKKDYQVTPVRIPPEIRKQVRLLAAQNDTSMAEITRKLLALGIAAYEKQLDKGAAAQKTA
jgi:hypothetical protein